VQVDSSASLSDSGSPPEEEKETKKDSSFESRQIKQSAADQDGKEYFWDRTLHSTFLRFFSIFGKTWKVISEKMNSAFPNESLKHKNQLQCRTHG